jgi:hypothetical protein
MEEESRETELSNVIRSTTSGSAGWSGCRWRRIPSDSRLDSFIGLCPYFLGFRSR